MADCKVAIIPSEEDDSCPTEVKEVLHRKSQNQIHSLLQRWTSRKNISSSPVVGGRFHDAAAQEPALTMADLRRALESVAWRMDEEVGLERRPAAPNVSAFPCVSVSRANIEPASRTAELG